VAEYAAHVRIGAMISIDARTRSSDRNRLKMPALSCSAQCQGRSLTLPRSDPRLEEEPNVNPNTRAREFSLRDPDGYYVTISAYAASKVQP
jgi:hypothetical protein